MSQPKYYGGRLTDDELCELNEKARKEMEKRKQRNGELLRQALAEM